MYMWKNERVSQRGVDLGIASILSNSYVQLTPGDYQVDAQEVEWTWTNIP
jgi:hypothetical protein